MGCHILAGRGLYNGFPFTPSDQGFSNVGLEHIAEKGIFTRGVLVDRPGTVITVQHLEAWEKAMGVKVSSGDVLRTGRWVLSKRMNLIHSRLRQGSTLRWALG